MGCTCSKKKRKELKWPWKNSVENTRDYLQILDERRVLMLSTLEDSPEVSEEVVFEWRDLTLERDLTLRKVHLMDTHVQTMTYLLEVEGYLSSALEAPALLHPKTISALKLCLGRVKEELSGYQFPTTDETFSNQNTAEMEVSDEVFSEPRESESEIPTDLIESPVPQKDPVPIYKRLPIRSLTDSPLILDSRAGSRLDSDPGTYRTPSYSVNDESMATAQSSLFSHYKNLNPQSRKYVSGAGQAYRQWMGGVAAMGENMRRSREELFEQDETEVASDVSVD